MQRIKKDLYKANNSIQFGKFTWYYTFLQSNLRLNILVMTTNSFGSALPPFDFQQPVPAIAKQARLLRRLPFAAAGMTGLGTSYCPSLRIVTDVPSNIILHILGFSCETDAHSTPHSPVQYDEHTSKYEISC